LKLRSHVARSFGGRNGGRCAEPVRCCRSTPAIERQPRERDRHPPTGHVYIERFLQLDGWVFSRRVILQTGSDGVARLSWSAPTLGRWRMRSFFRGTVTASPSSSGYLVLTVH